MPRLSAGAGAGVSAHHQVAVVEGRRRVPRLGGSHSQSLGPAVGPAGSVLSPCLIVAEEEVLGLADVGLPVTSLLLPAVPWLTGHSSV